MDRRRLRGKVLGVGALMAAMGAGCVYMEPAPAPQVPALEVTGGSPLRISVGEVTRRALTTAEMPAYAAEGARWGFEVQMAAPPDVGAKFTRLVQVTRSLSGASTSKEEPFALEVFPGQESRVTVYAVLWTSTRGDTLALSGSHQMTFHGTDSRGSPITALVRVPLK